MRYVQKVEILVVQHELVDHNTYDFREVVST